MAEGSPDLVDYLRLAEDAQVIERVYELAQLPRLQDVLAEPKGTLSARFAFWRARSGRAGASVAIRAEPWLTCQRCMQGFAFPVQSGSEVEFAADEEAAAADTQREIFRTDGRWVRLRDLAEEELLLALPIIAACSTPQSCAKAPSFAAQGAQESDGMRRPFSGLQDLLKKP
ncbi:MAG TPA: YceD family protein [Steroidobacteraceae bacterium]|nr:YceD family protein [Steroidobacteraceae bacterium]